MPRRPGRQSHQNEFKFKHNKGSKTTKKILAIPITGLCLKCYHIVQWRKEYRKYKPLKAPKRCAICKEQRIYQSYHIYCSECSPGKCAKCGKERERELIGRHEIELQYNKRVKEIENSLVGVRESERRKILREIKEEIKRENGGKFNDEDGESFGEYDSDNELDNDIEIDGEDGSTIDDKVLKSRMECNKSHCGHDHANQVQFTNSRSFSNHITQNHGILDNEEVDEDSDEDAEEFSDEEVQIKGEDTFVRPPIHEMEEEYDSDDSFGEVFKILKK